MQRLATKNNFILHPGGSEKKFQTLTPQQREMLTMSLKIVHKMIHTIQAKGHFVLIFHFLAYYFSLIIVKRVEILLVSFVVRGFIGLAL